MEIIPGILATTEEEYSRLVEELNKSDALIEGWVQLDLMDGKFVPNTSISAEIVRKYPLNFHVEAQLMVEDPMQWVEDLAGVEIERFIAPVELGPEKIEGFLMTVAGKGMKGGLMINPETSLGVLRPWLERVETILVMSVDPGFGGQEFIRKSLSRVEEVRKMAKNVRIEVDGGITPELVGQLVRIGSDAAVLGADRLIEKGIDDTLEEIWEIATTT